jgi:uncharacterized protein
MSSRPGLPLTFRVAPLMVALAIILLVAGSGTAPSGQALGQTKPQSPIPLPSPFNPIVDIANVIDADSKKKLESIYLNLKERADIEFAVVTVPTTGDRDIYDYSLNIARGWGIGSKEGERNGFLLVVAINDRKYFTQVSRHLEGDLPDGVIGQIQRERLVPQFKRGNYGQGIYDTVQAYVATLGAKRSFSIDGIDQSYAYKEPRQQRRTNPTGGLPSSCCMLLIIIFVIVLILSSMKRGGRGGGGGCLNLFLLGSLLDSGGRGWGRSSSGWGGGGFGGGGFGGGGGGFGGGFGGGGDFGGGGAGGSW